MNLNSLSPACGSKTSKRRLGRGIGSGLGKTSGRGHKGQKARAGGYHKINFEGGQMPIQRRLPKFGFNSRTSPYVAEVTLSELDSLKVDLINLEVLKQFGLVNKSVKSVKVILSGSLKSPVKLSGLRVTRGAKLAIDQIGGSIEESNEK